MRLYANINERTVRRKFAERRCRKRPLTIIDHTLPAFAYQISADGTRTYFIRVKRRLNMDTLRLGTAAEMTADEARAMAVAVGKSLEHREPAPPPRSTHISTTTPGRARRKRPPT